MKAVLLCGQRFSNVPAGVEHFSELLVHAFPELEILSFDQVGKPLPRLLTEQFKSQAVAQCLQKNLSRLKPAVVFFNGMYGWALPKKPPYLKVGICHGTYASFARHALPLGLERLRSGLVYSWFEKKSLQNADGIISNSAFTKKILQQDYQLESKTVPFAIDFSVFKPQSMQKAREKTGLPLGKKIVLFVGRPDYSKGFDLTEKMARRNADWHFVSVTFPKAKSPFLDCRGPFDSKTLSLYYAAADAVFFPSRFESFGFVTLEALACNRPIVTTDFGIAQELKHPACIIAKNHSLSSFQNALEEALQKEFSFDFSLEDQFGIERFAKQFKETLEFFLNKNGGM